MKYNELTDGSSVTDTTVYPKESVQRQGDIATEMEALEDNINSLTEEVNALCLSVSQVLTPDNKTENEAGEKPRQYECSMAQDLQRFNNTIYAIRDKVTSATRRVEL